MKIITTVILALLANITVSAQIHNFHLTEDNTIYWQKIIESNLSAEDIYASILHGNDFTDVVYSDDMITCRMENAMINIQAMGRDRMTVPIFVSLNNISGLVSIQFKEGRYRATIDKIIFTERPNGGPLYSGESKTIEDVAIKRNDWRKGFTGIMSEIYDEFFTDIVTFEMNSYLKDEW